MKEKILHQTYKQILELLQLNYCILSEEELEKQLNSEKINISEIFKKLKKVKPIIPTRDIDNYIVNNSYIWSNYKKDMFFQYAYMVVGKYTFENKKEFLYYLKEIYNALYNLDIEKLQKIVNELSKKTITKFEVDSEQIEITNKIKRILENKDIINIINRNLNNKEQFSNVFGSCIETVNVIIEKIIFIVLLFKEKINEQELVNILINEDNIDDYIKTLIIKELDIKDENNVREKQKILKFIYNQLVEEGYYLHGTSSVNKQSILTKGFPSAKTPIMTRQIKEINTIFEKHNLYMNFEGKIRELKLHQYYVTDCIKSSVMYAFQSPEYLSRFCSNGYHYEDISVFDKEAFWRRDYESCRRNVEILCDNYNFSKEEKDVVLENFKNIWSNNVKNDEVPIIFFGKKRYIGRNYSDKFDRINKNIQKCTIKDIIKLFELGDNIHDKRLSNINPESLSYFELPNIHKMYKLTSLDKYNSKQYIINKNKKYYPDIVISKSPLNNRGIVIDDNINEMKELNDKLVIIPQDKKENLIELSNYCIMNLNILIAESGTGITEKGKEYIKEIRKNISLSDIIKYDEKLVEKCMVYWNRNRNYLNEEEKMMFVHFVINQLLVKIISMKKYNKYFVDIDAALNRMIYFSIDKGNKLNRIVKQKVIDKEFVQEKIMIIQEILKMGYKPYYDLMNIFYEIEPR